MREKYNKLLKIFCENQEIWDLMTECLADKNMFENGMATNHNIKFVGTDGLSKLMFDLQYTADLIEEDRLKKGIISFDKLTKEEDK